MQQSLYMKWHFRKNALILLLSFFSVYCFSQKEGDIALGLSIDVAIDKDYNNFASASHFRYNMFDQFRVAPSFSYYLNKHDMKMGTFALNFHYLFPELIPTMFSAMKEHQICVYPIAGIFISRISGERTVCSSCSSSDEGYRVTSINNFGFDFGAGVDYKLPTSIPFFKQSTLFFEMQYQLVGDYSRPAFTLGLLYNFRKK